MADRLLGMETEYAITGVGPGGAVVDRQRLVGLLSKAAADTLPYAADVVGSGMFLQNASRFYVDCGFHPELATPECADPSDVVRYVLAGERMLVELARHVAAKLSAGTDVNVYRCNVDYGGTGSTWGCHESYLHRADPMSLANHLIPHLVTRVVYTGAGGFNPNAPGLEFSLSPRVGYLVRPVSSDSTSYRGIFHTKDESLSGAGYHRLHVLCGDSSCSQLATWLKVGTTALVVAMAEQGLAPGDGVQLWSPVHAMKTVARDPGCREFLTVAGGRSARAIDIQRRYLTLAETHAGDAFMPRWAGDVCRAWRAMLDRIEHDPASLVTRLDWAIKQSIYARHARQRGVAWESLPRWTDALAELAKAAGDEDGADPNLAEAVLGSKAPTRRHLHALAPLLSARGLHVDDLPAFLKLRRELFEIDTLFGQLGERGIFATLDRQGVLAHHARGVERIEEARTEPPAVGRAALRGRVIRESSRQGRYVCGWQQIWDRDEPRVLDLSDPFETAERWQPVSQRETAEFRALHNAPPFREVSAALREWIRSRGQRGSEVRDE